MDGSLSLLACAVFAGEAARTPISVLQQNPEVWLSLLKDFFVRATCVDLRLLPCVLRFRVPLFYCRTCAGLGLLLERANMCVWRPDFEREHRLRVGGGAQRRE